MKQRLPMALTTLLALAMSGCATAPPKPWEKAWLADPAMQPDRDPLGRRLQAQVHQSKEGASGGESLRGSGCGCN